MIEPEYWYCYQPLQAIAAELKLRPVLYGMVWEISIIHTISIVIGLWQWASGDSWSARNNLLFWLVVSLLMYAPIVVACIRSNHKRLRSVEQQHLLDVYLLTEQGSFD